MQMHLAFPESETKAQRIIRILNYGAGVDSTAMIVGMIARGWSAPDLIIFSDTGSEKPETLAYLDVMDEYLQANGWPKITRVKYVPTRAPYDTLHDKCFNNETLPSLAFGGHSCSLSFKVDVIDRYLNGVTRGPNKCDAWLPKESQIGKSYTVEEGGKKKTRYEDTPVKATKYLGYDAGAADIRRANKGRREDHQFRYEYPLQDWGWERQECVRQIAAAGLPVPIKSACWMCPASKPWELYWLAARHPELFLKAICMEDTARDGKHGLGTTKGLGRTWSWRTWAETEGVLAGNEIVMGAAELLRKAEAAKPDYESNDCTLPCMEPFAA